MVPEPHPTAQKIETVKELSDLFQRATGLFLADFTGLNVEQANELRRSFLKQQVLYRVVKNTLIRHACQNVGYTELIPHLKGPTALAISFQDPVVPVRVISDFGKEQELPAPVIKAGMLEKSYIGAEDLKLLQKIPPREVLIAQLLACLQSPVVDLVSTLNEIVRSFLAVLQAVIDKKSTAGQNQNT